MKRSRASRRAGSVIDKAYTEENLALLQAGMPNLAAHIIGNRMLNGTVIRLDGALRDRCESEHPEHVAVQKDVALIVGRQAHRLVPVFLHVVVVTMLCL